MAKNETPKDLAKAKEVIDARIAEREAAAVIADNHGSGFAGQVGKEIGAKIRKGATDA